jgi:hypothetical protein
MNVLYSDATLILSHGRLHGGSKFTEVVATKHEKAMLHVDLGVTSIPDAVIAIRAWLSGLEGEVLNVAGPRASSDSEIYEKAKEIVTALIRTSI